MNERYLSSESHSISSSGDEQQAKTLLYCSIPEIRLVSQERINYLWKKVRKFAFIIGKFNVMNRDIRLYGANKNQFSEKVARTYTSQETVLEKTSKWVILPNSPFKLTWNILVFLLLIWTAIFLPYRLCFLQETSLELFIIEFIIDLLFLVDIYVNFLSAFYDNRNRLVTNRKQIAKHYLKGWFLIDALACVPFQLIETDETEEESEYNKLVRLIRLPRLYRIFRVFRLFKLIRVFRSEIFVKRFLKRLKGNTGILRLINFSFTVLLIMHIVACFWYYISWLEDDERDSWVLRYEVNNLPTIERYLVSLYWVFTTLTTVGFGDIVPLTNLEKVFAMVIMVLGVGFYSYVISNMTGIIGNFDSINSHLQAKLDLVNVLDRNFKLPIKLVNKLKFNISRHHSAFYSNNQDEEALIKSLPLQVRNKLSKYLHQEYVKNINFFKERHSVFLMYIVPKLKTIRCESKELIYIIGDEASEIYFINEGRVEFRARNSVIFRTYGKGCYFGECEIIHTEERKHTVEVSSKSAELFTLEAPLLLKMMEDFPEIGEEVTQISQVRTLKHNEAESHVINLTPFSKNVIFPKSSRDSLCLSMSLDQGGDRYSFLLKKRDRKNTNEEIEWNENDELNRKRNLLLWQNSDEKKSFLSIQKELMSFELKRNKTNLFLFSQSPGKEITGLDPRESLDEFRYAKMREHSIEDSFISQIELEKTPEKKIRTKKEKFNLKFKPKTEKHEEVNMMETIDTEQ